MNTVGLSYLLVNLPCIGRVNLKMFVCAQIPRLFEVLRSASISPALLSVKLLRLYYTCQLEHQIKNGY